MIGNPLFSLYASHEKMTTMECNVPMTVSKDTQQIIHLARKSRQGIAFIKKKKKKFKKRSNTVAQSNYLTRNGTEG